MADTVTHNAESHRFEIWVDGELAGLTQYTDLDSQRIFFHTEVGDAFGGRGLAGALVGQALDETIAAGLRIVPVCPYVAGFIERHDSYKPNADRVTPAALEAVNANTN